MAIKKVQDFLDEVVNIRAAQIRKSMNRDLHVLIVNVAEFARLVRLHLNEVRRVAEKATDPDIIAQLETQYKRKPYTLAKKLYNRFILILEEELNKNKFNLSYKVKRQGNVSLYMIQADGGTTDVFSALNHRIISAIRKRLVFKSKSGSLDRVLSVVIAGIDIEVDKTINSDTSLGSYAKTKTISGAPISSNNNPISGAGIQLGHTRGPATVAAKKRLETIRKYQRNIVGITGIQFETQQKIEAIHKLNAEMRFNNIVYDIANKITGQIDINIIALEQTAFNAYTGSLAAAALKELDIFLKKNAETLITQKGSRPIINNIVDDIEELFLTGKKPKRKRINRRYKKKKTIKENIKASSIKINTKTNTEKLLSLVTGGVGTATNLDAIIELINRKLEDYIRADMGKGGSREKLNWRTGRFGRSAKVVNLTRSGTKGLLAEVKYHGWPYTRFEKGGDLYKTLRDPKGIFGRSIRRILQDERIANLSRVQVTLNRAN